MYIHLEQLKSFSNETFGLLRPADKTTLLYNTFHI